MFLPGAPNYPVCTPRTHTCYWSLAAMAVFTTVDSYAFLRTEAPPCALFTSPASCTACVARTWLTVRKCSPELLRKKGFVGLIGEQGIQAEGGPWTGVYRGGRGWLEVTVLVMRFPDLWGTRNDLPYLLTYSLQAHRCVPWSRCIGGRLFCALW